MVYNYSIVAIRFDMLEAPTDQYSAEAGGNLSYENSLVGPE
jgi:hypothetical protein